MVYTQKLIHKRVWATMQFLEHHNNIKVKDAQIQ